MDIELVSITTFLVLSVSVVMYVRKIVGKLDERIENLENRMKNVEIKKMEEKIINSNKIVCKKKKKK